MLIGAHVRGGGALVDRLERGVELGADAIQVFTQSPRAWKPTQYEPNVLAAYREAAVGHPSVRKTFCHATYLINLATPDDTLYQRSVDCLVNNLSVARGMAASGLVLHIGSHKGAGTEGAVTRVATALLRALDDADDPRDASSPPCPILLENAAGAGGTVGRTLEELEVVLAATGKDERLGVCIDTQHLWASGVDYSTVALADAVVAEMRVRFGLGRLGCLHLNDSKVELGSNRDRHENLGHGAIGAAGLASLLGHPDLANAPALLEVPGEGDGPRAVDVLAARAILAEGTAIRSSPRSPAKAAKSTAAAAATKAAKATMGTKATKATTKTGLATTPSKVTTRAKTATAKTTTAKTTTAKSTTANTRTAKVTTRAKTTTAKTTTAKTTTAKTTTAKSTTANTRTAKATIEAKATAAKRATKKGTT